MESQEDRRTESGASPDAKMYFATVAVVFVVGVILTALGFAIASKAGRLASPCVTDNFSLNEKLGFLKHYPKGNVEIVCVGSSLALNNIDSQAFLAELGSQRTYVNVAAFGMKIGHTRHLLRLYLERFHPKLVILPMGLVDFLKDRRKSDYFPIDRIDRFLGREPIWLAACRT